MPKPLYAAYRASSNYVSPDGRTVQFSTGLKAGDPGSTPALDAVPAIRRATTAVAKSIGAADSAVGGQAPALYDISAISNSDLIRVIPIAILAIGLLLALVLRSLVAPLYLIASVGSPISPRSACRCCCSSTSATAAGWSSSCRS